MVSRLTLLVDVLRAAAADLVVRPLRTLLTFGTLVVSIAVAVLLISTGGGLRHAVARMLGDLGEGQILVTPGRTTGIGGVRRSGREIRIRYRDMQRIDEAALPSFEGIAAYYDLRGGGATSWKYSIPWSPTRAVAPGYHRVRGLPLVEGRWFTRQEEEEGQWVAVLNEGLRKMIFRDHKAVGNWIEWRGRRMTVVGVVRDEALFPYIFFIPYQTVSNLTDARYITGVIARPRVGADWEHAVRELRRTLAGLGGFDWTDENALEVETNHEFTEKVHLMSLALHALVLTIAAVSLFLGGLGVANMMVIAVTERTREIGLRKALGATARTIFTQVFLETALILAVGGAAGMGLGFGLCRALSELPMTTRYSATIVVDPRSAGICLAVLAAVGFISALVPARRAAALTPVEALRWE